MADSTVGVKKLTEYLAQTRRQAELAIDNLNTQVATLTTENAALSVALTEATEQRDYYKNLSEQYRTENSKKWRLQERCTHVPCHMSPIRRIYVRTHSATAV
jgi:hypothetical protein